MSLLPFSHGVRLDPVAKGPPEALVVLLPDFGASAETLTPVAMRWAAAVPTTAFIVLDTSEQRDPRVPRPLGPLLEQQLRAHRLDASRLVLVGFGYGGTLALHLSLHQEWVCAGVLAFAAELMRPLPRLLGVNHKIRLIACAAHGPVDPSSLRDVVASLTGRGIDARGVTLAGPVLSDEAIRHGAAYLVELVATAQRGNRFHIERENHHAQ
jgi:pimeloyl-ACP methyl ester carboxylesterase